MGLRYSDFIALEEKNVVKVEGNLWIVFSFYKNRSRSETAHYTNATLLIYQGENVMAVQKLLRHKSVRTTQTNAEIMGKTIVEDLMKCSI